MKRLIFIFTCFIILSTVRLFSDDAAGKMDFTKYYYIHGMYRSTLTNGIAFMDLVYKGLLHYMTDSIPDITNMDIVSTDQSYSIMMNNGITEESCTAAKTFSNTDYTLTITEDTSPGNTETYENLIKTYDYLSDKGNYEKVTVKYLRADFQYLINGDSAYLVFNDQFLVILKAEPSSYQNWTMRIETLKSFTKLFLDKFSYYNLSYILK